MTFTAIRSVFLIIALVSALQAQEVHRPDAPREGRGTTSFGGRIVSYVAVDGLAIAEGDVVLGPVAEIEARRDDPGVAAKSIRKESNVVADPRRLWPSGIVPYVFNPNLEIPGRVEDAIAHFAERTQIRLVERNGEADYVEFVPSTGCSATVGRRGGRQTVNLARFCSLGTVVHEIGHAIGLWHEQARADRDQFITIDDAQIDRVFLGNFPRTSTSLGRPAGPYDFDSVMHYPSYGFSIGGKVIETIPPGIPIGQRIGLSSGDVREIRALYGEPQQGVIIATAPAGLRVLVDGESFETPVAFDWAEGEQHVIEVPSPQQVSPIKRFLFARWADDAPQRRMVTVGAGRAFLLAAMIEQNRHSYRSTSPALGQVLVDPSPEDGFHTLRSEVHLTAVPAEGAYFLGWSGIGEFYKHGLSLNPIDFVLRSDRYRLRGVFSQTKPVEIATNRPGRRIRVDGSSLPLPFKTVWTPGEVHRLHVDQPETSVFSPAIQSVFDQWEDGSSTLNREVVVDQESSGFRADFSRAFNLALSSVPIQGGEVFVVPRPNGDYVPEGRTVTLAAVPDDGHIFSGWVFDVEGRQPEQTFTMDRQYSVLGFFVDGDEFPVGEPVDLTIGPAPRSFFHHNYVEIPPDALQVEIKLETLTPDTNVRLYARQFEPPTGSPDGVIADAQDVSEDPVKTLFLNREEGLQGGTLYVSPVNGTLNQAIETRITVTVTGGAPLPIIDANKGALTFVSDVGGDPAPQRIIVRNSGGGALRFIAATETPWLDVTPN